VPNVVHHIVLRAAAETWVSVRQSGGRTLLTKTMNAGETWPVPSEPNLLLDTGNANALVLEVDGVPARLTGAKGIVIHNVPLDADLLGSGMAVRLGH
jgi:cytoskeleton protein RodZ